MTVIRTMYVRFTNMLSKDTSEGRCFTIHTYLTNIAVFVQSYMTSLIISRATGVLFSIQNLKFIWSPTRELLKRPIQLERPQTHYLYCVY